MKDKFKLLNNVDIDLEKYEDLNINKEKLKLKMRDEIKANSSFKKCIIIAASVCIFAIGLISAGVINPSLADSIPIVKNIFEELNYKLNLGYIDHNDIQQVGSSITSNGTTITVEEVISDGSNIFLTYSVKSDKKLPRQIISKEQKLAGYDENSGDIMLYGNVRSRTKDLYIYESQNDGGYFKDDYNFIGMVRYEVNTKNLKVPESINFEIDINYLGSVMTEYEDMLKGHWRFNLNIDTKSNVKTIDINQSKDGFKLNNISISPYSIVADIEFPESFIATKEEEKNNIEKSIRIDLNGAKNEYYHSIDEEGVDHGNKQGYMSLKDGMVKLRPSIVLEFAEIKDDPKNLRISFDNVKDGNDRKKVIFDVDLNKIN